MSNKLKISFLFKQFDLISESNIFIKQLKIGFIFTAKKYNQLPGTKSKLNAK